MPKLKGGNDESSGGQHSAGKRVMLAQSSKADSSGGQHSAGNRGAILTPKVEATSSGSSHSADDDRLLVSLMATFMI